MSIKEYLDSHFRYSEFMDKINSVDLRAGNAKELIQQYSEEYASFLNDHIKNVPITDVICLIDILNNTNPIVTNILLREQNEMACRASLVLQRINGIDVHNIKNHVSAAISKNESNIRKNGLGYSDNYATTLYSDLNIKMLNCYVSNLDVLEVEEQVNRDLNEFVRNLDSVDEYMFSREFSRQEVYPAREDIITSIFLDPNVDIDALQHVYDEVMLKNPCLKSFDYSDLLVNENDGINYRNDILTTIKGIYRKLDNYFYYCLSTYEFIDGETDYINSFLTKIVELNKEDREGLRWFFRQTAKFASPSLLEFLKKQDYFNEYYDEKDDTILKEALDKLINEDTDIDRVVLEELGKEEYFFGNYEYFLDKYINSTSKEYKEALFVPLITGLIEIQKIRFGLDISTRFTFKGIDIHNLGYFDKETNEIHVNPAYFDAINNKDQAIVLACDTVFHETRHAYQKKMLEEDTSFSFDNLVMAIDNLSSNVSNSDYYYDNYTQLSFERDADDYAYVDTMTLFDNYPELKKYREKAVTKYPLLKDYIRRENYIDIERYYGLVDRFIFDTNSFFDSFEHMDGISEFYIEHLKQYPVISLFFDIDEENNRIRPKSDEYFDNKLKEFEAMPDCLEKKEGIYSIKAFRYSLEIGKYLRENSRDVESHGKEYNDEYMEELVENVGPKPVR